MNRALEFIINYFPQKTNVKVEQLNFDMILTIKLFAFLAKHVIRYTFP